MSNNFMDNANATSVVTAIGDKIKTRDKTFYGTEAQWAALSTAQKKEYDFKATPDGGSKSSMIFADVPVGTILSYGGVSISKEWMLCQGQELLKADYPELYSVIADRFGTASDSNHFKLPDLRGEFLRGSGTNSHANQGNGAAVGAHQDATAFPMLISNKSHHKIGIFSNSEGDLNIYNKDSDVVKYPEGTRNWQVATGSDQETGLKYDLVTVRPTNTSVNFIIKVKNSVDVITDINNYSTEEKVIGVWTDGKPLYQKTVPITITVNTDLTSVTSYADVSALNVDNIVDVRGMLFQGTSQSSAQTPISFSSWVNADAMVKYIVQPWFNKDNNRLCIDCNRLSYSGKIAYITIQYTKTTD